MVISENDRDVLLGCLAANDAQLLNVAKKRRLYLRDISVLLGQRDDSPSFSSVSDSTGEQFNMIIERLEESPGAAGGDPFRSGLFDLADVGSVAEICRNMAKNMKCPSILEPHIPEGSSICYFRNRFSDSAGRRSEQERF